MADQPDDEASWLAYQNNLRAFLRSRITNPHDAEDVFQDVLLKSYQALPELRSSASIKPWLFQIAQRAIVDYYRSSAQRHTIEVDELWYQQDEPQLQAELMHCLAPFIQRLPEEFVDMMNQVELQGKSQKLFAQEQGVTYSTLKSRVQKGRRLLREQFDLCCHFALDSRGSLMECEPKSNSCKNC